MLPSFCKQTIAIVHPSTKTDRGSTINDWSNATTTTVAGCSVQPRELVNLELSGRENAHQGFKLYLPTSANISKGDRVTYNSQTYTVFGIPTQWVSPSGSIDYQVCEIREWEG